MVICLVCDHPVCNVVAKLRDLLPDVQEKSVAGLPTDHHDCVDWDLPKYVNIVTPDQRECGPMSFLSKPKHSSPTALTVSQNVVAIAIDVTRQNHPKTMTVSAVVLLEMAG